MSQEPGCVYLAYASRDVEIKRLPESRDYSIIIDGALMGRAKNLDEAKRKAIKLSL